MLLLVVAVLASAMWLLARGRQGAAGRPGNALQMVPVQALVVVTADLNAIRTGPYHQLILSDAVPGLGGASCKTQVVDRLQQLAIWTSSERPDELGVVALGAFTQQAVWECARDTIEQRGGRASSRAERGFQLIVDETLRPEAAQIAVRSPGLLLVGPEGARSAMIAALEQGPDGPDAGMHAGMRRELGLEGDVILSAFVGPEFKRKIERMAEEPTPALDALESVAAAVQLGATTRLQMLLWCRTAEACDALADRLQARRVSLVQSLPMVATGVAALVQGARVERQGTRLRVSAEAASTQVLDVLQRLGSGATHVPVPGSHRTTPHPAGSLPRNATPAVSDR
jgi:hypothetical protein